MLQTIQVTIQREYFAMFDEQSFKNAISNRETVIQNANTCLSNGNNLIVDPKM